ncbi:DUF1549 domain-containing protein [Parapedobacter sp. DT-150]
MIKALSAFVGAIFIHAVALADTTQAAMAEQAVTAPERWWGWEFLGRLHPLMVHFPVTLLLIGAIMELATLRKFESQLRPGIRWMVFLGAGSAAFAVLFGWLLASSGDYGGDTFILHQWTGWATAILGAAAALLLWFIVNKHTYGLIRVYRGVLFLTAMGIFIAGHYGGSLTHGQDYLIGVTPWAPQHEQLAEIGGDASSMNLDWASFASDTASLSAEQEAELNIAARTILAHHCYQCHSSDKSEGKLRLDDKELVFKGGESGPVIQPGDAQKSELIRRVTLPAGHKEAMPGKGKPLGEQDIEVLKLWINKGAPWPDGAAKGIFREAKLAPRKPELPAAVDGLSNPIDLWVNAYFEKKGVEWQSVVDDRTFLRRVFFDIIGLPPTPEELQQFEADTLGDKRNRIIETLLAKNDDYATHWTTFWNDLLRNDYSGTGYITNGRFNISDWLYRSLASNKPYKQFVMELLDPDESSKGFIKGIEWRGAVNSSQTTAMQAAQNVSQALLGLNLKCASCHDSFVSNWKLDDAYAFANIFSEKPLEINRCDIPTGKMADTRMLWQELGRISKEATVKQKSAELAESLTKPENGRLYRTVVNRIWAQLMGRGIVAPTDEMDKEPWSDDLLDWLAVYFVEGGYDIKQLIYLITTSKIYQQPSMSIENPEVINSPKFVFTGMLKRKLTAEQFADAVSTVVHPVYPISALKYNPYGEAESYQREFPFVRASLVQNDPFLTALGRPSRENVTSVRDGQSNLLQAMELTNGTLLNETLAKGASNWVTTYKSSDELIHAVYRQSLGREPTDKERRAAQGLLGDTVQEAQVQDLLWAVVLLPEFQFID